MKTEGPSRQEGCDTATRRRHLDVATTTHVGACIREGDSALNWSDALLRCPVLDRDARRWMRR